MMIHGIGALILRASTFPHSGRTFGSQMALAGTQINAVPRMSPIHHRITMTPSTQTAIRNERVMKMRWYSIRIEIFGKTSAEGCRYDDIYHSWKSVRYPSKKEQQNLPF